jgi:acetyltransferase-like isoleucine patch superfamily enzyme
MKKIIKIIKIGLRYFRGIPKIILWKLKYRKRLKISLKQNLRKKIELHISGNSKVHICKGLSNRDNLSIKVEHGHLKMGENCFFNLNCSITCFDNIEIGDSCLFANNVVLVDHDHSFRNSIKNNKFKSSPIIIGNNVWIGANSVILKGTKLGDNCVVGAGSVINGKYPPNTVIVQKREIDTKTYEIQ